MLFISCLKLFSLLRNLNFCLDFLVTKKFSSIRLLKLISQFMTPQTGQQIITINMLGNILSKSNQAMKFYQLKKYIMINIFLQKSYKLWCREFTSRPVCVFIVVYKLYVRSKKVVSTLDLIYIGRPQLGHTTKKNFLTFQTVVQKICSVLISHKKVSELVLHHVICPKKNIFRFMLYETFYQIY